MYALAAFRLATAAPPRVVAPAVTFEDVVGEFQDEVFGVALRMLGDREAAAEVTSATFLKAYRAFGRYAPGRPLRNWLLAIAVRESITHGRRLTRERARLEPAEAAARLAAPERHEPQERALEREERDRIRAAVANLPELYRVPIVLRYFNDLSLDEIAEVTGRPRSTVGVQLLRGRALLRDALAADR